MAAKEEIVIVGIPDERELEGAIRFDELKQYSYYSLDSQLKKHSRQVEIRPELSPYFAPMMRIIKHRLNLFSDPHEVEVQNIFQAVNTVDFIRSIPLNLNQRETSINIQILKTAVTIFKRGLLSMKEISDALFAFALTEKKTIQTKVPLEAKAIQEVLRMLNKTISEDLLYQWIRDCDDQLEYRNESRENTQNLLLRRPSEVREVLFHQEKNRSLKGTQAVGKYICPHEFLLVACNSINNFDMFNQFPKRDFEFKRRWDPSLMEDNPNYRTFTYVVDVDPNNEKEKKKSDHPFNVIQRLLRKEHQRKTFKLDSRSKRAKGDSRDLLKKEKTRREMKELLNLKEENNRQKMEMFRKQLRSELLHCEIKTQLKSSDQNLSLYRFNQKFLNSRRNSSKIRMSKSQSQFQTHDNQSQELSQLTKVRSSREFTQYRPKTQGQLGMIANAAFNHTFMVDRSPHRSPIPQIKLPSPDISEHMLELKNQPSTKYFDPKSNHESIFEERHASKFTVSRKETSDLNNYSSMSNTPTGQYIGLQNRHSFLSSAKTKQGRMREYKSESVLKKNAQFYSSRASLAPGGKPTQFRKMEALKRGHLGETRKKDQKLTVSNMNQLGSFPLMRNPSLVLEMHKKFAHSRKIAAQEPDLLKKIDSMIEDAAWSAQFSQGIFKEAKKMRSTLQSYTKEHSQYMSAPRAKKNRKLSIVQLT